MAGNGGEQKVKNQEMVRRLKKKFVESNLSQAEFAKELGVSRQTLGHWLNGVRAPDADNLLTICKAMNVSVDWLLGIDPLEKMSADKELRFVSDYIGISEASVSLLHAFNPGKISEEQIQTCEDPSSIFRKQDILSAVDFLLSSPTFFLDVADYVYMALHYKKMCDEYGFNHDIDELSEDELDLLDSLKEKGFLYSTPLKELKNAIHSAVSSLENMLTFNLDNLSEEIKEKSISYQHSVLDSLQIEVKNNGIY